MSKFNLLREAVPYLQEFHGKTFVVKIGGKIVEDTAILGRFTQDVALLHAVGIKVVVVHGGGSQATQLLRDLRHESRFINGRRITDEKTLEVAKMVYGGKINTEIISTLRNNGVKGVGISGIDANLIVAERRPPKTLLNKETGAYEEIDFGHVGDVIAVDVNLIHRLLESDYMPVVACLGADRDGNIFNINGDTVACKIAAALPAHKFINVTTVRGILQDKDDENSLISYLDIEQAEALLKSDIVVEGMMPKLESCIAAIRGGVQRACLINGADPDALLAEVFTSRGHGTMIANPAEKSRYQTEELVVEELL